ncbi:MAG TPA: regulatory iron-sulfur-containing complex subunit RicT [Gemmatimonadaceae bacterium]
MPLLIEVAFKGNRKEFFRWESDEAPPRTAAVVVDADRGEDLGRVHAVGPDADFRSAKVPHGLFGAAPARVAKRLASPDDLRRYEEVRAGDDDARRKAAERVKANALVMKVTDAEWQWDRKKLTFYFTAEKRVDFRTLVRELASMFRTRIELKQIGVRDEAKRLDGVGRCGRQYCSASWLPELRPVNLGVAKDQRLSLNPSQISGACGRLMCCLRYEHEFYVESRRKYPKEGKVVRTSRGEEKVIANDIFRERVTLRAVEGEMRVILLAELRAEMLGAGDPLAASLDAAAREVVRTPAVEDGDDTTDLVELESVTSREQRTPREPATRRPAAQKPAPESRAGNAPPGMETRAEPAPSATPESDAAPAQPDGSAEGERRQRRRGRRGGRRNRPGGAGGRQTGGNGEGAPPEGPNE